MRRALSWVTNLALTMAVLVPSGVLALVLVERSQTIDRIAEVPTPFVVEPTMVTTDGMIDGSVMVSVSPGTEILSPGGSGRVTAIHVAAGSTLHTGDRVFDIDGLGRLAAATPVPFYRELRSGSVGADVLALKALLMTMDIPNASDPASDTFDAATGRAVRTMRTLLGERDASTVFSPDLVVWLPSTEVPVASVLIEVGASTPALGQPILRESPTISMATVELPSEAALSDSLIGGPVIETSTGRVLGTLRDRSGAISPDQPAVVAAVAASSPPKDDTAALTSIRLSVTIRQPTPTEVQVVPASAIMTSDQGSELCLWLQASAGWEAHEVAVSAAQQAGSVALLDTLPADSRLLANPIEVLADASCPSS